AEPRVLAAAVVREEMAAELLVELLDDVGDPELLGAFDSGVEIAPEVAQHLLPVGATAGDLVELVLELGREVVTHDPLEEAGEERGHEPAAVLGNEALLLEPHVFAILQHLKDRGVSRGPADSELLELLDEAR